MSYDKNFDMADTRPVLNWIIDWISDWFGLFDIAVGIITFTVYYPTTQEWWLRKARYK